MTTRHDTNRGIGANADDREKLPRYTERGRKFLPRSGLLERGDAADPRVGGPLIFDVRHGGAGGR
jgi:hypothetical protein